MTQFSFQLYSSRNYPPVSDTLNVIAETGYAQVEGYGALMPDDADLGALRAEIDAAGLTMPTTHVSFDTLRNRPERAIEIAKALGVEAVFGPFLAEPDRPKTAIGWEAFGAALADAARPLQDAGLVVGWHNHDFEFEPVEGHLPIDLILAASDTIMVEFDVAWSVKAGENPVKWIEANRTRIAAAHIKDIAPNGSCADEDGWADVGHGTLDWPTIFAALRASPCRWFVAEHDNPNDYIRFAKRSLAAMKNF